MDIFVLILWIAPGDSAADDPGTSKIVGRVHAQTVSVQRLTGDSGLPNKTHLLTAMDIMVGLLSHPTHSSWTGIPRLNLSV